MAKDFSHLSDDEIRAAAGISSPKKNGGNLSSLTDAEIMEAAGLSHKAEAAKAAEIAMGQANAFKDLFSGVGQGLVNATAAPLNLVNALESKAFGMKPAPLKVNFRGDNSGIAGNIGEFVGGAIAPNPASKINLLSKVNPASLLNHPAISKIINAIPQGAVMGAGAAATNSGDLGSSAGMGAGINALLSSLPGIPRAVLTKGAEKYKDAVAKNIDKYPALHNNRKQISEIAEQIPGVPVNLSELAKHEAGKSFYTDFLGHAPFTGVRDNEKKLLNKAYSEKDSLLDSIKWNTPYERMRGEIVDHLKQIAEKRHKSTSKNFNDVFDAADKAGANLGSPEKFINAADKIMSEHEQGLIRELPAEDVRYIDNLRNKLYKQKEQSRIWVPGQEKGSVIRGDEPLSSWADHEVKDVPLKKAHFIRSKLGEAARNAKDGTLKSVYSSLKDALTGDMEQAITSSGNEKLSEAYKKALKFHAEKYLPYKHPDIAGLISNKKDRNTVENVLLKTQHEPILNELPLDIKNMIAYLKVGKREGQGGNLDVTPAVLSNKILSMDKSIREKLFSPRQLSRISALDALSSASQKAQTAMKKPPTGYRNMHEGILAGLASLGKGGVGLIAGGNPAARVMESPEVRNALINNRAIDSSALMKDVLPKFMQSDKAKKITKAASKPNYLNSLLMMLQQ